MTRPRAGTVPITLSESSGVRYLHFGSAWVQGAMLIARPDALVLEYVRRMMGWLLFLGPAQRVLQLGLGAGALTRYCLSRCKGSQVTVVEIASEVIETAHDWFHLPRREPRLKVVHASALEFLAKPQEGRRYSVLQVDLYDMHARGPVLDSLEFYRACRGVMTEPGICVVNLFGEHATFAPNLSRISRAFDGRTLTLPPTPEGNQIVFAFNGPALEVPWQSLIERAARMKQDYELPAQKWVLSFRAQMAGATQFSI